jgi:hypothetical protein
MLPILANDNKKPINWFNLDAYINPVSGRTAARLFAEYELLFTQRLICSRKLRLISVVRAIRHATLAAACPMLNSVYGCAMRSAVNLRSTLAWFGAAVSVVMPRLKIAHRF